MLGGENLAEKILAVDLKDRRIDARLTQDELGKLIGTDGNQVYRIESGKRNISLAKALACARILGPIKLLMDDQVFVLRPDGTADPGNGTEKHIPDTDEHEKLDGIEHTAHCHKQLSEAADASGVLLSDVIAFKRNDDASRESRVNTYKELYEAKWALDGWLHEDQEHYPDLVSEGERMALKERGLWEGVGRVGHVA